MPQCRIYLRGEGSVLCPELSSWWFLYRPFLFQSRDGYGWHVQEYLEENDAVAFDVFLEKIWDNIREIYRRPQDVETKEAKTDAAPPETTDDVCLVCM